MAAALHDVDDHKVFEKSVHYQNCRYILTQVDYEPARIEKVVEMISLVSFTVNGVTPIPKGPNGEDQLWKGIPRDADRLEALGCIGIARCIAYGVHNNRALYHERTPRFRDAYEIWTESSHRYFGPFESVRYSTLDYFLRGIMYRGVMSTGLPWFCKEAEKRLQPITEVLLVFGRTGILTSKDL